MFEPGASSPQLRLAAARQLLKSGIPVWVFIAPLLPGLADTEEALSSLLHILKETGIKEILLDYLNPYTSVVYSVKNAYRRYFPDALPDLEEYLRHPEPTVRKLPSGCTRSTALSVVRSILPDKCLAWLAKTGTSKALA